MYNQLNTYSYVNGIDGAKQYQMMPNQTVLLMDSENPMFYLKTSNQMGQATIRCFKFEEMPLKSQESKYATIESIESLNAKIDALILKLGGNANESNT